ncbi:MAG: putative Fe-S center protein [Methanobacterium sp. Maddingley MBC34]|nr:MAG: putative Fe-S center protein [Methanobacterium sp. Maddingley MBC34]
MSSEVYFSNFRSRNQGENKTSKIKQLFGLAGFGDFIQKDDLTAIKLHFGERGNDTYLKPVLVSAVVEKTLNIQAKPFLTDTNTLYYGSRHNSVDHLQTAIKNGFAYAVTGAPVIIADGISGDNWIPVEVGLKHFQTVKIAGDIEKSDSMLVLSHFKGHGMSGFGGAIKNLAMGCASSPGKIEQHKCAQPVITDNCNGCGTCIGSCPLSIMSLVEGKAVIDLEACVACNNCLATCPESAIELDSDSLPEFMEMMVEYAYGAVKNKRGKIGYINFLMDITPDCDCEAFSDAPIVPDIGILASKDPVALDMASYDLVNQQAGLENSLLEHQHHKGGDKFRGVWEGVDGRVLLEYAEEVGLGFGKYELINL